jgi:hypothetical protein
VFRCYGRRESPISLRIKEDRIERASVEIHRVTDLRFIALAMAGQIDRDDVEFARESGSLLSPESFVAAPTVHEEQRILSRAVMGVMHLRAIELSEARLGRWRAHERLRCRTNQSRYRNCRS